MADLMFDYQFRLILIGDSTVGKSSLLKYFNDGKFAEVILNDLSLIIYDTFVFFIAINDLLIYFCIIIMFFICVRCLIQQLELIFLLELFKYPMGHGLNYSCGIQLAKSDSGESICFLI